MEARRRVCDKGARRPIVVRAHMYSILNCSCSEQTCPGGSSSRGWCSCCTMLMKQQQQQPVFCGDGGGGGGHWVATVLCLLVLRCVTSRWQLAIGRTSGVASLGTGLWLPHFLAAALCGDCEPLHLSCVEMNHLHQVG